MLNSGSRATALVRDAIVRLERQVLGDMLIHDEDTSDTELLHQRRLVMYRELTRLAENELGRLGDKPS